MDFIKADLDAMKRKDRSFRPNGQPQNDNRAGKRAYKPKRPFNTVEGIGSSAWESLDLGARGLLMEFYKKFNGYNRNNLSVTFSEIKHLMSSLLFSRYVWQLRGFGFLDMIRQGRLEKNCSIYALSDRWRSLSNHPDKLKKIESNLANVEKLKRMPGSAEKREEMWKLRAEIG